MYERCQPNSAELCFALAWRVKVHRLAPSVASTNIKAGAALSACNATSLINTCSTKRYLIVVVAVVVVVTAVAVSVIVDGTLGTKRKAQAHIHTHTTQLQGSITLGTRTSS